MDTDEEVIDDETKPITMQIPKWIPTAAAIQLLIKEPIHSCGYKSVIISRLYILYYYYSGFMTRDLDLTQEYSSSDDSSEVHQRDIADVIDLTDEKGSSSKDEGMHSECQNAEHQQHRHLGFLDLTQDSDAEWVDSEQPTIIDLTNE